MSNNIIAKKALDNVDKNQLIKSIEKIDNNSDIKTKNKNKPISKLILEYLNNNGNFIKTDIKFYYFYKKENILFEYGSSKFSYLISSISDINPTERIFNFIIKEIELYIFNEWENVSIKRFSYYKKTTNTLYIFNNWNKIIKINKLNIAEIFNWDEWIIFIWKDSDSKWNLVDIKDNNENILWELIKWISLEDGHISIADQHFILYEYVLSLFFPELQSNRWILTLIWNKWSWKTFFLEMLLLILTWENNSISNLPSKDDDLKTNLVNEYLCYFDNVDEKVADNKIDLLCSVSTWASIKIRKLYTNSEQINQKLNCFLWITSRNPTFKRDDFTDRLLLFFLKRREKFSSDNHLKDKFHKNRDSIMTKICHDLQKKIINMDEIITYETKFRLSDFSNLIKNFNKWKEDEMEKLLIKLQLNQQELATQSDSLLDLIKAILYNNSKLIIDDFDWFVEWKEYKAEELHRLFHKYSKSNPHLKYWFISPKSLWKVLCNNHYSYKNIHNILINNKKIRSNITVYSITNIPNTG